MDTNIYLGKLGRAFGPYTEAEIEELKDTGAIRQFSWIWNHKMETWEPLDPAPAPIDVKRQARVTTIARHDLTAPLEVVCHDRIRAICGEIREISESGCVLVSQDVSGDPVFSENSEIRLNLLDPKNGRAADVRGRLGRISREKGRWKYRVSWRKCPELVREAIAAA